MPAFNFRRMRTSCDSIAFSVAPMSAAHHEQVAGQAMKVEFVEHAIGVLIAFGHARCERRDVSSFPVWHRCSVDRAWRINGGDGTPKRSAADGGLTVSRLCLWLR